MKTSNLCCHIVLILLLVISSPPTFAWGALGHQVICDATWRLSTKAIKKELAKAAKRMGYKTFASACVWADHVRAKDQYDWLAPLHYINVPQSATTVKESTCLNASLVKRNKKANCVITAVAYFKQRMGDARLSQRERDEAVLLLGHFVGDLHQPLHVSYAEDRGGTQRAVRFKGEAVSLHRFWDVDVIRCQYQGGWRTLGQWVYERALALKLEQDDSLLSWADESLALTRDIYRDLPKRPQVIAITARDCAHQHKIALKRLVLAALRLAQLLDKSFHS